MAHEATPGTFSKIPSQYDRLESIRQLIEKAPRASSASEAHRIVAKAFQDVEGPLEESGDVRHPMTAGSFDKMERVLISGKSVYFAVHVSHILFVSESGAIDIRRNKKGDDRLTETPLRREPTKALALEIWLQKPDAYGDPVFFEN